MNGMKPSIGRAVHWVHPNTQHFPAIITRIWSEDCVNLVVFGDFDGLPPIQHKTSVLRDGTDSPSAETWHWPELIS